MDNSNEARSTVSTRGEDGTGGGTQSGSSLIVTLDQADRAFVLKQVAKACNVMNFSEEEMLCVETLKKLQAEMLDEAYGIAAPQIGVSRRIFVIKENDVPVIFINPVVVSKSRETKSLDEACLSAPGFSTRVKRSKSITVRYFDENLMPREREFSGIMARVIQHEMDHLNGVLVVDHFYESVQKETKVKMERQRAKQKEIAKRRRRKKGR